MIARDHYRAMFRARPARHLAAGMRLRAGHRKVSAGSEHPLVRRRTRTASCYADPRPRYGVYAPVSRRRRGGVRARHRIGEQVWIAEEGYPGDGDYRDFYRDIGFDLEYDYIKPYIHPDGMRRFTGIKYFRITGKTDRTRSHTTGTTRGRRPRTHAGNFMFNREKQIEHLHGVMERPPLIICAVRRGVVRPLVVRRARVHQLLHAQSRVRPEVFQD